MNHFDLLPDDPHDRELLAQAHPPDWVNPRPAERYHLVVIGAGTAGLVCAIGAAGLGARVALVERALMGGDCLNFGCVPSKAILRSARAVADVRRAAEYGIRLPGEPSVDFPAVMQRMRRLRAEIAQHDSAERCRAAGVDVFLGPARFTSSTTVDVDGTVLRFGKAVIATGARATVPELSGLRDAGFLTNESVFSLTELPKRLLVVGAGPIGCELAQAFARFGSQVTLLARHEQVLPKEDAEPAAIVAQALQRDGVALRFRCELASVERSGNQRLARFRDVDGESSIAIDAILLAVGRTPNVDELGLEAAGVAFDRVGGVMVDDRLRTTARNIYAAGDVCSTHRFTHAAYEQARIVIRNALFRGRARVSRLVMPWCTFTDPEVAHVGLSERAARHRGIKVRVYQKDLRQLDRAVLDGETDGLVRLIVAARSDRVLGATLVSRHAGESISEITTAMVGRLGLGRLSDVIHPYPTQAEALRRLADDFLRSRLTPRAAWWLRKWLEWTG